MPLKHGTIPLKPATIQFYGSWDKRLFNYQSLDGIDTDTINVRYALKMINYDLLYLNSPDATIINTDEILSSNLSRDFINKVCSCNDGDLAFVPSCECGELSGLFYQGTVCHICKTEVTTAFVNKLAHSVWISIPDTFPPFVHPIWYHILNNTPGIGKNGIRLMDAILDIDADIPDTLQHIVTGKGFKWFYENHHRVIDELCNTVSYPKATRKYLAMVKLLYDKYKDCMFYRKIPILHKELHPVFTNDNNVKRADRTSKDILDVAYNMTALTLSRRNRTTNSKSFNRTFYKIYKAILNYHKSIIDIKLGDKMATIRHHCLGTRVHWSYRSVIVPIQGVHVADELELPWALVVNMFKLHILNKLMRRGYSINTAIGIHMNALISYNKLIDEILEEIIAECPWKGPAVLLGRNPTLKLFAIQTLFLTKIKKDIHDETIGISPLILENPNADFDGDELWGILLNENAAVNDFMALHPRESMLSVSSPEVSSSVSLSEQTLLMLHKFIHDSPMYEPIIVKTR